MTSKRKYRSKFEEGLGAILEPAGAEYEPYKIPYWVPANYTPDFVLVTPEGWRVLVEAKGYFRPGDQKKYKAIRDQTMYDELVFLLQYPNKKVRKGAQLTMSGWCEKEGIRWFDDPKEVLRYAYG